MLTMMHARLPYRVETLGVPNNSPMHITVFGIGDEKDAYKSAARLVRRFSKHSYAPTGYAISINREPPRAMTVKEVIVEDYLYEN
jgi:hypothetical protein